MPGQPSNFGSFVGLGGYDVVGDSVVVTLPLKDVHLNQLGLAHGGALATLADNSMGLAALVSARKPMVTVEFKISFLRPVSKGVLKSVAKVDKIGQHLAFVGCQISDEGGNLVAKAIGTYMLIDGRP
jgi:acyl-CoA thioesterase